jgi:ubiquinone/menaquinone biosynthesis C-methylase UbiE
MASRGSNLERNRWTVSLLGIEKGDHILELGFGPGVAIGLAAHLVGPSGRVTGIDHSHRMLAQAVRRNRSYLKEGRVELLQGRLEDIAQSPTGFDKVFSCNVMQFQPNVGPILRRLGAVMKPGGRLATTFQPRTSGATSRDAEVFAKGFEHALLDAGFVQLLTYTLALSPVPAVCILASAPEAGNSDSRNHS